MGKPEIRAYIFELEDCPLANAYAPEIARLVKRFGPKGVRFTIVIVDPDVSLSEAKKHVSEYGLSCDVQTDPKQSLAHTAGATVSPEAAVYFGPTLAYRGRIDDLYADRIRKRPKATHHDLADALNALIAGKNVKARRTRAVGCILPG